jgi:small conductance mechanosensitive channel
MIVKTLKALIVITLFLSVSSGNFSSVFAANEQNVAELEQLHARIERKKNKINFIEQRLDKADAILVEALEARLDIAWLALLESNLAFVENVKVLDGSGADIDKYRNQAIETLESQDEAADEVAKRIRSHIKLPGPDLSAADLAAAHSRIFAFLDSLNRIDELLIQGLALSRHFGVDVARQEKLLRKNIKERAANGSVLLELASQDVTAFSASVAAVPDDKEAQAMLTVAKNLVRGLAEKLDAVLVMMGELGMDTSDYQAQVLSATGQITTDLFNFSVFTGLLTKWWNNIWNVIAESGPDLIFNILLFFIIIYGFRKLADIVQKLVERGLEKSQLKLSELLRRMVVSIVRNCIFILGVLVALSQVGISLGPLLAGLGVVGFVVGFALQDSLSNFAAGGMILIYRPFDVGDLVEAGGVSGRVNHMSLVNTTILTLDNQTILIPNNKIWGDVIKNVTAQTMRRVDMMFGISYTDDIPKTERVLQEILDSNDKVLDEPEPDIRLHELADSSVNFIVRPWVKMDDYWEVYWNITRSVKMRFDEEEISIPFPQRDVHIFNEDSQ